MTRKLLSNVYVIKLRIERITQIIIIILISFLKKPQITRITLIFRLCIYLDFFLTNDFTDFLRKFTRMTRKLLSTIYVKNYELNELHKLL